MNAAAQGDAFPFSQPLLTEPAPIDWLDVLPPEADCLRDYQMAQVEKIPRAMRAGYRRILIQLPTGGGKTHEIAAVVAAAVAAGLPVLIIATRTRLVRQLHERLKAFGIRHGVIASSLPELRDYSALVQIASADTLHRRAIVGSKIPLPPAGVVIFDEAHLATAETRLNLLDSYPDAIRIGFTATPARKSGKSLGAAFQCLIPGPSIRQLTALGTLVPVRIFNTPLLSSKELKALPKDNDNDYQASALSERFNRPKLVGGVLENWLRIAKGKRTLVFAIDKAHAASLLEAFLRSGVATEMLTDNDDETTREEVVGRLDRGETQVVVNCFLLAYGVDVPSIECVVLARPTRSLVMYLQAVGRGLRPSPESGKVDLILIDHGHVVENLGLPQSDFGWTIDSNRNVNREALDRTRTASTEQTRTCKACAAIWLTSEQGNGCPECGWTPEPKSRAIAVQDADLEEMAETAEPLSPTDPRILRFYQEALGWTQKHKPQKWREKPNAVRASCWHAAREKFKLTQDRVPNVYWELAVLPASIEVAGFLKYRDIKWARSRSRAA
jgi:DNA repair protein RadD